jgi:hypothetical protein
MLSLLGTVRSWIVSRRNRRDWIGPLRNDVTRNIALVVALALFGWIAVAELVDVFCK